MAKIELTDVVDALSRLQLNYTSLAEQFYNIFFNPVPMDVTIVFIDKRGEELEVTIPNRAKDQKFITNGEGSPITNLISASKGTLYQDVTSGEVYIKYGDAADNWSVIIDKNKLNSIIQQGHGEPSHAAPIGTMYVDVQHGFVYIKRTSTGNDGWYRIDSYQTGKVTETFTITAPTSRIKLDGICKNKDVLSIYEDGVRLNPSLYNMPANDGQTIVFKEPIKIPGTGEKTEVLVEYFVDLHVTESEAEQKIVNYVRAARFYAEGVSPTNAKFKNFLGEVDEINRPAGDTSSKRYLSDMPTSGLEIGDYYYCIFQESLCIWNGNAWNFEYSAHHWRDEAEDIYSRTYLDITQAKQEIDQYGTEWSSRIQELYDSIYNLTVTMTEYIDENYEKFSAGVNRVENYAQQVAKSKNAIDVMYEDIKVLERSTHDYQIYVEQYANDFALHSDFDAFTDEVNNEMARHVEEVNNELNNINVTLTSLINGVNDTLTTNLENEVSERTKADRHLRGSIKLNQSTFENWTASHSDLGDFSNLAGYFKRDNMPIDLNGIYNYSKNIWKVDPEQNIDERGTNIELKATKDCSYYAIDLGDYMESETHADTDFDFTIVPDRTTIDFSLPDKLDNDGYTREFNNVVCTIRCYIKNDSIYTPSIEWDYTKITWLGAEPELEPNKSYVVEFISYDMMTSWEAHILGICQPAIELDTFTTTFTINCPGIDAYEPSTGTSDVRLVAVIGGRELTVENTYQMDNSTKKVTAPLEIERKFLGKALTEVMLKSDNTPAFHRFYVNGNVSGGGLPINSLAQNRNYTLTCSANDKTVKYTYYIHVNSDAIEKYMRGGLTLEEYKNFPAQQEMEDGGGVTFVNNLPANGGTGLYVKNSDLNTYWTWNTEMEEWIPSARIHPTGSFITSLQVDGKFSFNNDIEDIILENDSRWIYHYDPSGPVDANGVQFDFSSADGIMSDPLVSRITDTIVTKVKVKHAGLESGKCLSANDTLPVKVDGGSYINVENEENWN